MTWNDPYANHAGEQARSCTGPGASPGREDLVTVAELKEADQQSQLLKKEKVKSKCLWRMS